MRRKGRKKGGNEDKKEDMIIEALNGRRGGKGRDGGAKMYHPALSPRPTPLPRHWVSTPCASPHSLSPRVQVLYYWRCLAFYYYLFFSSCSEAYSFYSSWSYSLRFTGVAWCYLDVTGIVFLTLGGKTCSDLRESRNILKISWCTETTRA